MNTNYTPRFEYRLDGLTISRCYLDTKTEEPIITLQENDCVQLSDLEVEVARMNAILKRKYSSIL